MFNFKILLLSFSIFIQIILYNSSFAEMKGALDNESLLVKSALRNNLSNNVKQVEVEYDYLNNDMQENIPPSFVRVTRITPKHGTFRARIYYTDNSSKEINGRYRAFTEVPMTKRFIKKGEIISNDDLSSSPLDISYHDKNILSANDQIIGYQAQRDLSPGHNLKNYDISRPTLVNVNDTIDLLYQTNNITVKAIGVALKQGAQGETIKVKNEKSGKVVSGIVVEKGIVQVNSTKY